MEKDILARENQNKQLRHSLANFEKVNALKNRLQINLFNFSMKITKNHSWMLLQKSLELFQGTFDKKF
jgi:hypothetical protein